MHTEPLSTAVAGIGGFGTTHHNALLKLEQEGRVRVVATCDPALSRLEQTVEALEFAQRGVALYESFEPMVERHGAELQWLTVAAPIRHHAPMHRSCVERGIACYLEKPPTLDPGELEEMIRRDATARFATQVGFNYIYQPLRHTLKQRIASGEFGRLLRVGYLGLWKRPLSYYARNGWAGRLMLENGYVLLDSCCGNAMAHHLHNILFFAGSEGLHSWARPAWLEVELYRANAIEGVDTIFARGVLENGVEIRLSTTHACDPDYRNEEILTCEEAEIRLNPWGESVILREGKVVESWASSAVTPVILADNLALYADYLHGQQQRPQTMLKDCRSFVHFNALLYIAARRIHPVSAAERIHFGQDPTDTICIPGITAICERAVREGAFPSEQGVAWARPGGCASLAELSSLRAVLGEMLLPS